MKSTQHFCFILSVWSAYFFTLESLNSNTDMLRAVTGVIVLTSNMTVLLIFVQEADSGQNTANRVNDLAKVHVQFLFHTKTLQYLFG